MTSGDTSRTKTKPATRNTQQQARSNGHRGSNGNTTHTALGSDGAVLAQMSAQPSSSTDFHFTEYGNEQRFLERHGDKVLFCPAYGWLVYQGGRWARDSEHLVRERIKETVRSMHKEAALLSMRASREQDEAKREKLAGIAAALADWARKSETKRMTDAVLVLAQSTCTVDVERFDRDPWLLNLKNGTLNLRTGLLRPHRREDYLMKQAAVALDPNAQAPTFHDWLKQITRGDTELAIYLQVLLGYALTGDVAEQKWWIFYGKGQNGKSTLVNIMQHLLADYAVEMDPKSIIASGHTRSGAEASPDMARLAGARLVVASETEAGDRLKTAQLKHMTGGGQQVARHLHRAPFQFTPEFTFVLDTNHKPNVRDRGFAFWRRVRIVPFDYRIPDNERDGTLEGRMIAEGAGILNWLIAGLRSYLAAGRNLPPCVAVESKTEEYRQEQDIIDMFLRERCIFDPRAEQPAQAFYKDFRDWVEEQMGERAMAQRSFAQALQELGYSTRHTRTGWVWEGLRLRTPKDPPPHMDKDNKE